MNLKITDNAIQKVSKLITEEGNPDLKLRIFVQGGGCSGFQYGFTFEELPPEDDDFTFERNGVGVVVDSMSMQYLNEAEIDYEKTIMGENFKITNPNVKATCGCGSSFTTY